MATHRLVREERERPPIRVAPTPYLPVFQGQDTKTKRKKRKKRKIVKNIKPIIACM